MGLGQKITLLILFLRGYGVEPDFKTGQVYPVNLKTGARLNSFGQDSWLQLNDVNKKAGFTIVAEQTNYSGTAIPVNSSIASNRLLTGSDFDPESIRQVADGSYWVGEEFGPFLLHVDGNGTLLRDPIRLPNFLALGSNPFVESPSDPLLTSPQSANLPNSRGFEGTALNTSQTKLYAMLEGPLTTDPKQNRLLIHEFDLATQAYTGKVFQYAMDNTFANGYTVAELTAISDTQFLVLERDSGQGDASNPAFTNPAKFKRVYRIDITKVDADGYVKKDLVVDLLNIPDPKNLGGNGTTNGVFTFPFVTTEAIQIIDSNTVLIVNDNNYPFSVGRTAGQPDNNEFILVDISSSASAVPEPLTIMGALTAFGLGGTVKRKLGKQKKAK